MQPSNLYKNIQIINSLSKFDGEKRYIATGSLEGFKINLESAEKITYDNKPSRASQEAKKGDLIFAKMQGTDKTLIINDINNNYIYSSGFFILRPSENLDKNYLYQFLRSEFFHEQKDRLCTGATQKALTLDGLKNIQIPLPPLSEQQAIATKLDQLQHLINLKQQAIAKTDELAKSIFLEMFGDPMTNEKGWEMKKLEEVVENNKHSLKTGPFGSSLKKEFYTKTGRKIYGQEQVIKGDINYGNYYISNEKYEELKNYTIKQGDILISLVGSYGNLLIIPEIFEPGIINPRLMKISFDKEKVAPIYFQYFFESGSTKTRLEQLSHGGTMGILNLGLIKSLYIPLPPISLQKQFADIITEIESQKSAHKQALTKLEELYQSEMQRSFSM